MKKLAILFTLFSVVVFTSTSAEKVKEKDVLGNWKYKVETAPPGYESGILNFFEKENELKGEVKFNDGSKTKFKSVELKDGWLKFELYVDYELISGKVEIDGNKMTGTVNTPDGDVPLTAEKVE